MSLPIHYYPSDNLFPSPWPHCVSLNYSDLVDWKSKFEEIPIAPGQPQGRELLSVTASKRLTTSLVKFWLPWGTLASLSVSLCVQEKCWCPCTWLGTLPDHLQLQTCSEEPTPAPILRFWGWCLQSKHEAMPLLAHCSREDQRLWGTAEHNCPLCLSGFCKHF